MKRTIALLLSVLLVFGALPAQAFAEENAAEETTVPDSTVETTVATEPEETVPVEETIPAEETTPVEETISEEVSVPETDAPTEEIEEIPGLAPMMGTTDEDLTWVLDSDGKLTITGTGAMSYDIP